MEHRCADTYTLALPENIPPTFRGRALKFSYQLHVGVCRAGAVPVDTGGTSSRASTSRVMKVPIRVYNNVVGMLQNSMYLLISN